MEDKEKSKDTNTSKAIAKPDEKELDVSDDR